MRKLKVLLLIVIILLIFLIVLSANINNDSPNVTDKGNTKVDVTKENKVEVFNNGGSILEYNGYVYYIKTQKVSRRGV